MQRINLKEPLLPHQEMAAFWMAEMKRIINTDAPGVGKTLESLAAAQLMGGNTMVLTISAVIMEWREAIRRFLPDDTKLIVIEGSRVQRLAKYELYKSTPGAILITTYSAILHDLSAFQSTAKSTTTLILDEATSFKNPEAKCYDAVTQYSVYPEAVFVLTGTPITLSLADIYYIAKAGAIEEDLDYDRDVAPYLLTQTVKAKGSKYTKVEGATEVEPLRQRLEKRMISRSMRDALEAQGRADELPEINFDVKPLLYSKAQLDAFIAKKREANNAARDGHYKPLRAYQDFLQICSSQRLQYPDILDSSPKEVLLLEHAKQTPKMVVYVKYLEYLQILKQTLQSQDIGSVTITGSQSSEQREAAKRDFLSQDRIKVMFITGAGKYGLNLQTASKFLFIDLPNSPADVIQYFHRIYRIDKQQEISVILAFMENTVEEDIFRRLYIRQGVLDAFTKSSLAEVYKREDPYTYGFLEKDYTGFWQTNCNLS